MPNLTRRAALIGTLVSLSGCGAISSLNAASKALDTYDLLPAAGTTAGRTSSRTLLVALPQAPAALATDRIMIKPDAVSITYLPDARWADELPAVIQTLMIRSVSDTGRIGYVGAVGAGPVPDTALLLRIDAFEVNVLPNERFMADVEFDATLISDRDQSVMASRRFAQQIEFGGDTPKEIVGAFQVLLNTLLPSMTDWALQRV